MQIKLQKKTILELGIVDILMSRDTREKQTHANTLANQTRS